MESLWHFSFSTTAEVPRTSPQGRVRKRDCGRYFRIGLSCLGAPLGVRTKTTKDTSHVLCIYIGT